MTTPGRRSYEDDADSVFLPGERDEMRDWVGPPAEYHPGPATFCWHNAREFARSKPDEYLYAEGLVSIGKDVNVPHGWVVRKSDCAVIECTEGYKDTKSYRGICFEIDEVDTFLDETGPAADVPRRDRWHKLNPDGSRCSEAPGIFGMLAEERLRHTDVGERFATWKHWLGNGKCPP